VLDLKPQLWDLLLQIRMRTIGYGPVRLYLFCLSIGLFVWLWGPMLIIRTVLEVE
jgi:hypothetical protein